MEGVLIMDIPSYLIGAIKGAHDAGIKYVVVQELPTTGEEGIIYLVPKSTSKTNNIYDLAGNCNEWTQEAVYTYCRANRGGYYGSNGDSYPVTYRYDYDFPVYSSNDIISYRPVLYLK